MPSSWLLRETQASGCRNLQSSIMEPGCSPRPPISLLFLGMREGIALKGPGRVISENKASSPIFISADKSGRTLVILCYLRSLNPSTSFQAKELPYKLQIVCVAAVTVTPMICSEMADDHLQKANNSPQMQ